MSMKDVGILDGDLVAVHRSTDVRNRQIVVARLDDEVTVKRYRQEGSVVWLLPENRDFEPIRVDLREQSLLIEGVVVGVLRHSRVDAAVAARDAVNPALHELLRHPGVWRAAGAAAATGPRCPRDSAGWMRASAAAGRAIRSWSCCCRPRASASSACCCRPCAGSVRARRAPRRWVAWLDPPHLPYAPALAGAGLDPAQMLIVRTKRERAEKGTQTFFRGDSPRGDSPQKSLRQFSLGHGAGAALAGLRGWRWPGWTPPISCAAPAQARGRGGWQPRRAVQVPALVPAILRRRRCGSRSSHAAMAGSTSSC
jgi:hypothetical protein